MIDVKARMHAISQARLSEAKLDAPSFGSAYFYGVAERPLYEVMKRFIDLVIAAVALVLFSPLMALIAVLVRLDSSGPALFAQRRVGRNGTEFTLFKFRSMYQDADERLHREFAKKYIQGACEADENGCFKPKADPRVTRMGRFLRKTSLDELPQLWNVLKGDMSLVGPRPAVRYEVDEYERWQMKRLAVMPGLTGLAQINGRSSIAFAELVRHDIAYVEQRGLLVDLEIMLKTVPSVLMAKSAR